MSKFIIESNANIFNKFMLSSIISSVLLAVVGIVMIFLPELSNKIIGIIVGILFLISGANTIYKYFKRDGAKLYSFNIVFGIILAVLGLIIILVPYSLADFITVCLGLYFITIGANKVTYGIWFKIGDDPAWLLTLVVGVILILFGILIMVNPFVKLTLTKLVGVFLLLSSILDLTDIVLLKKRNEEISKIFW